MESLKLLQELCSMGESLKIETLQHFFKHFDPSTSKPLAQSISHFRIKELESADYRSAYGQLSDWIYGWTVQDVAEFGDDSVLDHFQIKRPTRDIDLSNDRERAEADRILKTYETLHQMTKRILNKYYVDIDEQIPRIGQGLSTFKNGQADEKENFDDEQDLEKVWALKSNEDLENQTNWDEEDDEIVDEVAFSKKGMTVRRASSVFEKRLQAPEVAPLEEARMSVTEEDGQNEFPEGDNDQDDNSEHSEEPIAKIESNLDINTNLPGSFQFLSSSPAPEAATKIPDLHQVFQVI